MMAWRATTSVGPDAPAGSVTSIAPARMPPTMTRSFAVSASLICATLAIAVGAMSTRLRLK
jgi:hypothetical protein